MKKGTIYMLPTMLGGEHAADVIPAEVIQKTIELRCFIVENIKTARRYLRKLDREFPIDDSTFFILNKKTDPAQFQKFLQPAMKGEDMGIMSEAGCPGVADPGAGVVTVAHSLGIHVKPLVGPSSILLALIGSGFSGQEFAFHGYLPKDRKERIRKLRDFEADTRRTGTTNLFMDTPFRNMNVLEDLLNELNDATMLSIASNITMGDENIQTMSVLDWREKAYDLSKKPTIFSIGKVQ
ncbi:MAG: SAM-dependent methyltransferase [bacterium]|nr:SAM-dependent methyltransferase [bacterium]